ncbi:hypothetical protein GGTG_13197 [Gaeumannomyces tritici R3-111a-1]|uniref:Uncharacterized protein n=1 Tax=Gaeumannomyces tritici (strain R3-111a-1) TaxID=644352 RepID=J3PI69_GAET3|nr:hypothetical protein GGTG_13197 [Gaeumannomyces tritici R3-111a-1]EJT69581.1 hypothetical protein GGTG_13197 [Gaeumannomyces tritici R3-111a-1]
MSSAARPLRIWRALGEDLEGVRAVLMGQGGVWDRETTVATGQIDGGGESRPAGPFRETMQKRRNSNAEMSTSWKGVSYPVPGRMVVKGHVQASRPWQAQLCASFGRECLGLGRPDPGVWTGIGGKEESCKGRRGI